MTSDYEIGVPIKGKANPYQEAIPGRTPKSVSRANLARSNPIFSDIFSQGKTPLADLEVSLQEEKKKVGKDSPISVSLFSGGGGMLTAATLAGFRHIAAAEFVRGGYDTLAANYDSTVLRPHEILEVAKEVAEEMGVPVLEPHTLTNGTDLASIRELDPAVCTLRDSNFRKFNIPGGVSWEETAARMGDAFQEFRYKVTKGAFENACPNGMDDTMPIWADDIRGLSGTAMIEHFGIKKGEIALVEGGPPCHSFSMAGKREKKWDTIGTYSEERLQSSNTLFDEFIRIVEELRPKTFIAENVPAMEKGDNPRKYTKGVLDTLRGNDYRCSTRIINTREHQVPQARQRLIIQGVRKDIVDAKSGKPVAPTWPEPDTHSYTLGEALELAAPRNTQPMLDCVSLEGKEIGRTWEKLEQGVGPKNKQYMAMKCHPDLPCPTITVVGARDITAAGPLHPTEKRKFTIEELKVIFGYPKDYKFVGHFYQQHERVGRSVPVRFGHRLLSAIKTSVIDSGRVDDA